MAHRNVHPFPARMAPELALEALDRAKLAAVVLDPMCGSGTVLKHAAARGHTGVGFDLDPLAVLMSRVACRPVQSARVLKRASEVVSAAAGTRPTLSWIDEDAETTAFVEYWFAETQRTALRQLAAQLAPMHGPVADVLRVALSRTIITKDRGASLARDVSHSRPHRVRDDNDYDVYDGFLRATRKVLDSAPQSPSGRVSVSLRDARTLPKAFDGSIDLVITSPPYLNAIDYMRGHRMSLIWFGHTLSSLRRIRRTAVGAERQVDDHTPDVLGGEYEDLERAKRRMLARYAADMARFCNELSRVLKPTGEAVLVVGDCTVGGVAVRNSEIVRRQAERAGLVTVEERSRPLPANSRYLPPPTALNAGALANRLRHEVVLRFRSNIAR